MQIPHTVCTRMTDQDSLSGQPPELPPHEAENMRRGMIMLTLFAVFFMLAVWGATSFLSGISAPLPTSRNFTTELMTLHRAFTGSGVTPFQSSDRQKLALWLKERVEDARVPDLTRAGLVASGVRGLQFGGGGLGMIRYRDRAGAAGDVIAVLVPKGRMGVPDQSVAYQVAGGTVWLQTENTGRLVYASGPKVDWVLISTRGEKGLLSAVAALLDTIMKPDDPA